VPSFLCKVYIGEKIVNQYLIEEKDEDSATNKAIEKIAQKFKSEEELLKVKFTVEKV
jgi:hypothetical protein